MKGKQKLLYEALHSLIHQLVATADEEKLSDVTTEALNRAREVMRKLKPLPQNIHPFGSKVECKVSPDTKHDFDDKGQCNHCKGYRTPPRKKKTSWLTEK